jgi:hypothetical protein
MSFITRKHLPRRTFIRGVGATLSLPLLEAMVPARTALAQTAANPAVRLGLLFIPHGAVMNQWTPASVGALELSPTLMPLAAHKDQVVVLSNLAHEMAGPQGPGDNGGDDQQQGQAEEEGTEIHARPQSAAPARSGVMASARAAWVVGPTNSARSVPS